MNFKIKNNIFPFILVSIFWIGMIIFFLTPTSIDIKVKDVTWERKIYTEEYQLITRECWDDNVPSDATVIAYQRKKRGAGKSSWYDNWVFYTVYEWVPSMTYSAQGRKGDMEFWPEVHYSEVVGDSPIEGNKRQIRKEKKYYIIAENDIKYEVSKEVYDKAVIGEHFRSNNYYRFNNYIKG